MWSDLAKFQQSLGDFGIVLVWYLANFVPTLANLCNWANVKRFKNNIAIWSHCSGGLHLKQTKISKVRPCQQWDSVGPEIHWTRGFRICKIFWVGFTQWFMGSYATCRNLFCVRFKNNLVGYFHQISVSESRMVTWTLEFLSIPEWLGVSWQSGRTPHKWAWVRIQLSAKLPNIFLLLTI